MLCRIATICVAAAGLAWLGGCEEQKREPPVPDRFTPATVPVRPDDASLEFDSDQQLQGMVDALRGTSLQEATSLLGPPAYISVWVDSNDPTSAQYRIEKVLGKGAEAYKGEHRRTYKVSKPTPGRLILDINKDQVVAAGFRRDEPAGK